MRIQINAESVTITSDAGSRVTFAARGVHTSTSHYSGSVPVGHLSGDYPAVLAGVVAGEPVHALFDCVLEMELPSRLLRNLVESFADSLADGVV